MDSLIAKEGERRGRRPEPRLDPARIKALRSRIAAEGKTIAMLADEIGEDAFHLYKVLSGKRAAATGTGHRVAVKLGLKDTLTPVTDPLASSTLCGGITP